MTSRVALRAARLSIAAAVCFTGLAAAAGTPPKPKSPPKTAAPTAAADTAMTAETARKTRTEAERIYAEGWALSEQAKQDETAGKADMAQKKFCKARRKYEVAVSVDSTYHQAWNMVGFCARHCGDYAASLNAYMKCLALAPDYEEAHEYLGELYLRMGDMEKARAQLAWLEARKSDEAKELAEKIAEARKSPAAPAEAKKVECDPDSAAGDGGR